jgi:hypothetical protein
MWVFTRDGFYSVVSYDPSKDREKKSPFKKIAQSAQSHVLVRGRVKRDLEALRMVVPNVKIVDDIVADYQFRAVITRRQWKKFLSLATDDIDYHSHFKEVMRDGDPVQGGQRYTAVQKIWSAMLDLQPLGAWGGYSGSTYTKTKTGKGVVQSKVSTVSSVQDWLGDRETDGLANLAGILDGDEDFTKKDYDTSSLSIEDVKEYVLADKDGQYPNFLLDDEVARCDPLAFAFWVKLKEEVSKVGRSNLHIDEQYLDQLEQEVLDGLADQWSAEAEAPPEEDPAPVAPPENVKPLVPPEKTP